MKTLIATVASTLVMTAAVAGNKPVGAMTDADWATLHALSSISPAKHMALVQLAGQCGVAPNAQHMVELLGASVPSVSDPYASVDRDAGDVCIPFIASFLP